MTQAVTREKVWLRVASLIAILGFAAPVSAGIRVSPESVVLESPEATQQLLVRRDDPGVDQVDLTHRVRYEALNPSIARINGDGLIEAVGEGSTAIRIIDGGKVREVGVEVRGVNHPTPVSFEHQIIPLLTKAGCNSGGCHGKAEGQNGFKLSVFGFDPEGDYQAIVFEGRGRRVFPASPERSLIVEKGSASTPHGGGKKIADGTLPYKRLVRWIAEGMKLHSRADSPVVAIEVEPREVTLAPRDSQQLRVTAVDETGRRRCVTAEAEYDSNATTIAGVNRRGHVQGGSIPGEAAILVRYMGHVTVARVTLPRTGVHFDRPNEVNFIDKHVWNKLEKLGIPPSPVADDATFLRRVSLDLIGTLPTAKETRAFLADAAPDKRARLIDRLLDRPEYADYWAMQWADILRVDRDLLTAPGALAMTRWLRRQFAENRPYDQIVREIVTAQGNVTSETPAGFYKAIDKPDVMSRSISQLFLGVRIECAQCHHHPSDRWGQDDYYALAGFFTGISRKPVMGTEKVVSGTAQDLPHPRTGKVIPAKALGAARFAVAEQNDPRDALADWMTSPENPFFARAIVNRIWAHYFGRGLIDPIDDLRTTNPASNEPLLEALAADLKTNHYDLKALTRSILNSRVYQLGPMTHENATDEQNFSHAVPRALPAEVLLDAICEATGVPEKFNGWPEGVRAIQMWDNRMPSYFLKLFGRPARTSVCECERSGEPSIAQALHLMNAPEIVAKIHSRQGRARKLAESTQSPAEIIDDLYAGLLARMPTSSERNVMLELFREAGTDRREAIEDVMWTLLNTKEFVYNH